MKMKINVENKIKSRIKLEILLMRELHEDKNYCFSHHFYLIQDTVSTIFNSHFRSVVMNFFQYSFSSTPIRVRLLKIDKTFLHFPVIRPAHGFQIYSILKVMLDHAFCASECNRAVVEDEAHTE
jgi:hypothetical protein